MESGVDDVEEMVVEHVDGVSVLAERRSALRGVCN